MGQKFFKLITNRQTSLHILAFPKELFTIIALFTDTKSQLSLAHTCKTIYGYHKEHYREEVATFFCNIPSYIYSKYLLERWLSETGWAAMKVTLQEISTDSQSNNSHPIRALGLNESSQLPNELNYERINILILRFDPYKPPTLEIFSLLKKVSNLKILMLFNVAINENIVSVLLSLSSLEIISLVISETKIRVLNIVECISLKEIEICFFTRCVMSIVLPSQVKRLQIEGFCESTQVDLSYCIQLQSL
jgi:hypothetical protein